MFKLYKCDEDGRPVAYHEAWVDQRSRQIVEHWGMLGTRGDTATRRIKLLKPLEAQFDFILGPARALGFTELEDSAFQSLIVEYKLGEAWTRDDHDKHGALEDALTEVLGWTGLGAPDVVNTGEHVLEVCCRVIDVDLARTAIIDALTDTEFSDYSRFYQE